MRRPRCQDCSGHLARPTEEEATYYYCDEHGERGDPVLIVRCRMCGATYRDDDREKPPSTQAGQLWLCENCHAVLPTDNLTEEHLWKGVDVGCPKCSQEAHIERYVAGATAGASMSLAWPATQF